MPASMISDDRGSSPNVIGSSMAMVGIGPIPGKTPISVPSRQPIRAKPRFLNDSAAPNPIARFCSASTSILAPPPRRQRLRQRIDEDEHGEQREGDAQQERFGHPRIASRVGCDERQRYRGERQADRLEQIAEQQNGG